jgi:hypothetical protein
MLALMARVSSLPVKTPFSLLVKAPMINALFFMTVSFHLQAGIIANLCGEPATERTDFKRLHGSEANGAGAS